MKNIKKLLDSYLIKVTKILMIGKITESFMYEVVSSFEVKEENIFRTPKLMNNSFLIENFELCIFYFEDFDLDKFELSKNNYECFVLKITNDNTDISEDFFKNKGFRLIDSFADSKFKYFIGLEESIYNSFFIKNMEGVEIHMLICKKDLFLGINNIKSLQKFTEFSNLPIIFHDDGSLNQIEKESLLSIPNSTIIDRNYADNLIKDFIRGYENCENYRLKESNINLWHKIKLFDYFYFSKTKRILGMDSDLLFVQKPIDLLNKISENTPFFFPDIQSAYCFQEPKNEIPVINNVNTGLIFIPSEEYYNIGSIENALSNLIRNNINYFPSWIEQSAFAHMFYVDGRYKSLNNEKYRIPYFQSIDINLSECLHFVSYPATRELYSNYISLLDVENNKEIYNKNFVVDFKDKKIPLNLKVKNSQNLIVFEYYWGLEKSNQNMLDHIFEINDGVSMNQFKFQSDKNGFFSIKSQSKKFIINHTYDWYGEMKWQILDEIKL